MSTNGERIRIDKWLWAARFFRTRALAQHAVAGGKVHVNGDRVKPARLLDVGDELEITRGEERFVVHVAALSDKRGPAATAQSLYTETPASRSARENLAKTRKLLRQSAPHPESKPDKRSRRRIIRFKEKG